MDAPASAPAAPAGSVKASLRFTEVARESGIDFTHVNGAYGRKLMPETVGSGMAFADFDGDGKPDVLIMNGTNWPGQKPVAGTPRLYRNLGGGKFQDVTAGSGLDKPLYGMGVAVADYDGDGKEDMYLTAVGSNHLLHNEGGFRFREVTAEAGVVGVPIAGVPLSWKWSASAAWLDYDRDGDLDLFVTQYVKWTPELDPFCGHNGVRGYCPPDNFEGARCTLFQNDGNGKFTDVSREVGLFDCAVGKSFGIAIADFNGDGWPDIAVSNDTWANFLFINEQGKKFSEKGVESGIAFAEGGKARAGMGIDVTDLANDGRSWIAIGNFADEGL
ncbi:MAG: VCBS repeat-containing protein, partial [bacterium]